MSETTSVYWNRFTYLNCVQIYQTRCWPQCPRQSSISTSHRRISRPSLRRFHPPPSDRRKATATAVHRFHRGTSTVYRNVIFSLPQYGVVPNQPNSSTHRVTQSQILYAKAAKTPKRADGDYSWRMYAREPMTNRGNVGVVTKRYAYASIHPLRNYWCVKHCFRPWSSSGHFSTANGAREKIPTSTVWSSKMKSMTSQIFVPKHPEAHIKLIKMKWWSIPLRRRRSKS